MIRLDKLRVILVILVICSLSLSANFFFQSLLRTQEAGKTGHKRPLLGGAHHANKRPQTKNQGSLKPDLVRPVENIQTEVNETNTVVGDVKTGSESAKTWNTSTTSNTEIHLQGTGYVNVTTAPEADADKWCPHIPPFLEGPLAIMQQDVLPQELIAWYPGLETGGRLRPTTCTPRQRLALIIPYRNRYPHLHIMLNNLIPILQRQQADVTFFVIEQAPPETFNRGALLNVGFLEAEKVGNFDCYIFHDVDLIPLNDGNLYRCGENPRHFAVSMNKYGYQLAYRGYFGGVVGFSRQQYLTVNGCSNLYFGWGGEDDDLLIRLRNKHYTMVRYDTLTARYDMIKHHRDKGNEDNPYRKILLNDALRRQDIEGLRTTRYKVNSVDIERLYTWINVSFNMTEMLQTAPDFSLKLMRNEQTRITTTPKPVKRKRRKLIEQTGPQTWVAQVGAQNWVAHIYLTLSLVTPKDLP